MPVSHVAIQLDACSQQCQGMTLQLAEKCKRSSKKRQGTTLQLAEKCNRSSKKRQGMTLVVPKMWQNTRWALALEGFFSGCNTSAPCPILSPFFWRKGGKPQISTSGCSTFGAVILSVTLTLWHVILSGAQRSRRTCFCFFQINSIKSPCSTHSPFFWRTGGKSQISTVQIFVCFFALTLLTGCKPVGPNYNRPSYQAPSAYKETGATAVLQPPPAPTGGTWQPANPSDGLLRGKWWEIYQDPQLNQLEERIAANNQTLRQALETYLAARDQVSAARAGFFPTLSAGPNVQREKISANGPSYSPGKPTTYSDFQLTGQASWEPDLWGRVRRTVEAARSNAQVSAADMANIDLSLHAEMAVDYFQLCGLDTQITLYTATVSSLNDQLDLTQRRLKGGIGTEADVAQARTQLETVRAQLIDLGQARAQYEHAIGTLANLPLDTFSIPRTSIDWKVPQIPLGVPSQLLERRPDIAAAERRVAAANAQIGIAKSAFYPNITLGGTGGLESMNAGTWIQGPSALWSLGAQASELLFDAGQRHALTGAARHNYEAQAAAYRSTVLAAFNDVEDQLSTLRILEQESTVEQHAVASAQHSLNLSQQRYKGGVTSFLEVLIAEQTELANHRAMFNLQTRQYVASVGLIRALGGGWDAGQIPK